MNINGEQYIRTLAQYIRSNERKLTAVSSPTPPSLGHLSSHRRSDSGSSFSMPNLWSFSTALTSFKPTISTASTTPTSPSGSINNPNKILITLDPHHIYYLLTKFGDLGLDVGVFEAAADFKRDGDTLDVDIKDIETSSITSSTSISSVSSAMSSLSLFSGWQGWYSAALKNETVPINLEIQYIYHAFTKLTGLKLSILNQKRINGSEDWPIGTMLSLTLFKHLTQLEIHGLPPKMFDGWDILQEKLEYISLQQGSIDDIYELFVDVVVDSMKRRKQKDDETNNNQVVEQTQDLVEQRKSGGYIPDSILPPKIWPNLRQVDLSDNSLTFVTNEPLSYINKVINLDLSQNLLIAVPSGLSQLPNLQNLNISNNMIESVTGIYITLSNVTRLDLRNNRIENLCGLERLWSLEYLDIRENRLMDWAEVGRMTELQEIRQIYVEGNPFTKIQPNYRVSIFSAYRESNKDIVLDGTGPGFNERRQLGSPKTASPNQKPPLASVLSSDSVLTKQPVSQNEQTTVVPILRTKKSRKFHKRVVKLDGGDSDSDVGSDTKPKSEKDKRKKKDRKSAKTEPIPAIKHRLVEVEKAVAAENDINLRLRRKKSGKLQEGETGFSPKLRPSVPLSPSIESEIVLSPGEDYRRKIEELRNQGGSAWLRVLSEMEYSKTGSDRLREPAKMKAIVDQVMNDR